MGLEKVFKQARNFILPTVLTSLLSIGCSGDKPSTPELPKKELKIELTNVSPLIPYIDQLNYYPRFSRDKNFISFQNVFLNNSSDVYRKSSDIYVMDSDGSNLKNITNSLHIDYAPAWTPNNKLVFASDMRSADTIPSRNSLDLFISEKDGSNLRFLIGNDNISEHLPDVSPDGKYLVFLESEGYMSNVSLYNFETHQKERLTEPSDSFSMPRFSPDGEYILFSSYNEDPGLYKMNFQARSLIRLTEQQTTGNTDISPDGKWIAYSSTLSGEPTGIPGLFVVRSDGSDKKQISPDDGSFWWWNPSFGRVTYEGDKTVYEIAFSSNTQGRGMLIHKGNLEITED